MSKTLSLRFKGKLADLADGSRGVKVPAWQRHHLLEPARQYQGTAYSLLHSAGSEFFQRYLNNMIRYRHGYQGNYISSSTASGITFEPIGNGFMVLVTIPLGELVSAGMRYQGYDAAEEVAN